jgi:hypothetical protein
VKGSSRATVHPRALNGEHVRKALADPIAGIDQLCGQTLAKKMLAKRLNRDGRTRVQCKGQAAWRNS